MLKLPWRRKKAEPPRRPWFEDPLLQPDYWGTVDGVGVVRILEVIPYPRCQYLCMIMFGTHRGDHVHVDWESVDPANFRHWLSSNGGFWKYFDSLPREERDGFNDAKDGSEVKWRLERCFELYPPGPDGLARIR